MSNPEPHVTDVKEGASAPSSARFVVVDTDLGVDDAQAIGMLLSAERRGELRVLGITTVAGNTSVKNATRNTRRLLATYGRLDVPVYAGAHCFLLSGTDDPPYQYHGENGLGNARFEEPLPAVKQRPEHAVTALSRLASEHKGELTVVALGPLTNIALAARMDQEFMTNINDIYLMGGNYTGQTYACLHL
ncbi:probable uridine nucleosidase 2 isoform X1 [Pollicipes pollicipes]|uniref:probable uridine nucleosidase 2 isoform X1 n=2 Tax=Pollicipes pollicipes TaxID=41117 RepID=UPI001884E7F4|nr:probable uridine nucleosidase 2 isoform X1 [Pollicipes pollicipes]